MDTARELADEIANNTSAISTALARQNYYPWWEERQYKVD